MDVGDGNGSVGGREVGLTTIPCTTYPQFGCEVVRLPPEAPHVMLLRLYSDTHVHQFPLTADECSVLGKALLAPTLAGLN